MQFKKPLIILLLVLGAFSAGRFSGPKSVEIREVEKVVYKEREIKDEDKKTRSTRRTVVLPDGTKTTEIVRETDKKTHTDRLVESESERRLESKTTARPNWSVGFYTSQRDFSATLDWRIFGGLFVGVNAGADKELNDKKLQFGVRFEF